MLTLLTEQAIAPSESFASHLPEFSTDQITSWVSNLPAIFGDGYLRIGAGHFGSDGLAAYTALHQLW